MEYVFTSDNFNSEVLNSDKPVLIDFYANWCMPCKMMGPAVKKISEEYDGRAKVGKVNVDEQPELAQQFNVMSIPMLVVFKNGQAVNSSVGVQPKAAILSLLK